MRRLFEATVGRRLLVRIWFHGVLLFTGVLAMTLIARWVMSDLDQGMALRHSSYLAANVAGRVLALAEDAPALAAELRRVEAETPLAMTVFRADDTRVASAGDPSASATGDERRALGRSAAARWRDDRLVIGTFDGDRLAAYAVVTVPAMPSVPMHAAMLFGAALVLAFVFVAGPLARSIARPIERLRSLARELGAGNLAVRANSTRHDEIGDLARAFDAMALQLQQLRTSERQLLGDVSHELRTPLARMRVVLDLACDAEIARVRSYLGEVAADLAELEQLVDDIIASARLDPESPRWSEARPPLRTSPIGAGELVDAAVARFRSRWPDRAIDVGDLDRAVAIDGDPALLRRVLDNLLDNARAYSDAAIELRVAADDAIVRVEVIDRGVGIAPEDRPHVFSAFFRADRSRSRSSGGVGLGLVLARRIVEAHGGAIGFDSDVDRGSRFWFTVPRLPGARARERPDPVDADRHRGAESHPR